MRKFVQFLTSGMLTAGITLVAMAFAPSSFAESQAGFDRNTGSGLNSRQAAYRPARQDTYSSDEILAAGHEFFRHTTNGFAKIVQHSFGYQGAPSGYIIGEEISGAFMGGLRYGEGVLHMKDGTRRKVYWQGPSLGFDFGGNGSRTIVLVYNLRSPDKIYDRFGGIEGSAYLVGGVSVNFQRSKELVLAPIRTGIGARLGANIGYLKYTRKPTWNPF